MFASKIPFCSTRSHLFHFLCYCDCFAEWMLFGFRHQLIWTTEACNKQSHRIRMKRKDTERRALPCIQMEHKPCWNLGSTNILHEIHDKHFDKEKTANHQNSRTTFRLKNKCIHNLDKKRKAQASKLIKDNDYWLDLRKLIHQNLQTKFRQIKKLKYQILIKVEWFLVQFITISCTCLIHWVKVKQMLNLIIHGFYFSRPILHGFVVVHRSTINFAHAKERNNEKRRSGNITSQ